MQLFINILPKNKKRLSMFDSNFDFNTNSHTHTVETNHVPIVQPMFYERTVGCPVPVPSPVPIGIPIDRPVGIPVQVKCPVPVPVPQPIFIRQPIIVRQRFHPYDVPFFVCSETRIEDDPCCHKSDIILVKKSQITIFSGNYHKFLIDFYIQIFTRYVQRSLNFTT
ncbi:hypothetical protein BpHYR1_035055 [Brachionus plicatilis]|uniref:Uncharacterized protein n=1 Tax=Brachionus plicatilis TaxID=10195 RepID=A0A3M7SZ88_BRAPC|nr:hypothetical protein BpHYR1_035055 [Brachionus plicatilis]